MIAGFALLAMSASGIGSDVGTRMYGGGKSDPALDSWILARVTHQMLHDPTNLFEGNIFYPSHRSVLFSDPLLGPAALVLPLRLFTSNPVLLYNAAVLLSLLTASYGFYRLALHLHQDRGAAVLAGIAIPFCAQQMVRLWHLNLLAIGFFPFLVLGLLQLLERPGPWPALLAGASFALQAGTCGYYAFSALFLSILVVLWHWRRLREPRTWLWLAVAGMLATVALWPYLTGFAYLRQHEAAMARGVGAQEYYSVDLPMDLLGSRSYLWQPLLGHVGRQLFPGFTVILFAALAVRRLNRRDVRFWACVALVFLSIAAGPEVRVFGRDIGPGPFVLLARWLPLFSAVRHPLTFAVPALMALGLLASLGLHTSGASKRKLALAGVLLAAVAETLGSPPARRALPFELPEVYGYLRTQPTGALLELPYDEHRWMWWSSQHGMPIVNGGGAFKPRRYTNLKLMIAKELRDPRRPARSVDFLKTWFPVGYVVLHDSAPAAYRRVVAKNADTFQFLHETSAGDRVYRVSRAGSGRALRRAFRDDQLETGTITARLRGPHGTVLLASLNGSLLARRALTDIEQTVTWSFPQSLVKQGLNMLELQLSGAGPEGRFQLLSIEADARVVGRGLEHGETLAAK